MAEGLNFATLLFRYMQDLSKETKEMRRGRQRETSRGFQNEEGPRTSYQQHKQPTMQRAPQHFSISSFLAEGDEWHGDGGYLENETPSTYLAE